MNQHLLSVNSQYDAYGSDEASTISPRERLLSAPTTVEHRGQGTVMAIPTRVWALDFATPLRGTLASNNVLLCILLFVHVDRDTWHHLCLVCRAWLERVEHLPQWASLFAVVVPEDDRPMRAILMSWLWDLTDIKTPNQPIMCRSDFIQRYRFMADKRSKLRTTRRFFQANSVMLGVVLSSIYGAANAASLWYGYHVGFNKNLKSDEELVYNYLLGVASLLVLIFIAYACMSHLLRGPYKWLARASRSILLVSVLIPLCVGLCLTLACARLSSVQDLCDHPILVAGLCNPTSANLTSLVVPSVVVFDNTSEWSFLAAQPQMIIGNVPSSDSEFIYYVMWLVNIARPTECPGRVALFVDAWDNSSTVSWPIGMRYRTPLPARFFGADPLATAHMTYYSLPYWTDQRYPAIVDKTSDLPQTLLSPMKTAVWIVLVVGMFAFIVAGVMVWKKLVKLVQLVGVVLD